MFSFLFGLSAGALCVLNPDGTRRLLATVIARGQQMIEATSAEASSWSTRIGEEMSDIVAEAQAQRSAEK